VVCAPRWLPPLYGRVVAEAQAMARPVGRIRNRPAAGNLLAPPRMPDDVRTGWLVRPGDAGELARALATALALDAEHYRCARRTSPAIRRVRVLATACRGRHARDLHVTVGC